MIKNDLENNRVVRKRSRTYVTRKSFLLFLTRIEKMFLVTLDLYGFCQNFSIRCVL